MTRTLISLLPVALLTSCATSTSAPEAGGTADTHEAMVRWINPAAVALWDVTNQALGESGGLDPALMDAAAWGRLHDAARTLEIHSHNLAEAKVLRVGAHNDNLEGFATRAEIQAMIDADPEGFRTLSSEMASHAAELVQAAAAHDPERAGQLAETLSERCSACHSRYWEKPAS